ncbi:MAG: zinc-dependent dehydrogenase [Thermodesulfovibrionales bacterium]
MKAVIVEEIGGFVIREVEPDTPAEGEALVRVSVTGLCRTDLKIIRSGHRDLVLPRIPGEEVVGTVEATGKNVAGITQGQRVYVYPGESCGICGPCRSGAENLCRSMKIMGFHRNGGFAEYVTVPARSLIPVPEGLSDEEAVFAEPLSCCLNALELARLSNAETICIWGGGPAGTLLQRLALAMGVFPHVVDPDERRASLLSGTTSAPDRLFDVCVVAAGSSEAYQDAMKRLGPRGRLVVFSGLPKTGGALPVDFNHLHYHEQTMVGAYGCSYRHGVQALDFLRNRTVPVHDLVSHRMPLSELGRALDLVERRDCRKIHLYPQA